MEAIALPAEPAEAEPANRSLCAVDLRLMAAVQRLADEISQMDAAYGAPLARRYLAVDEVQMPGAERLSLTALADWAQSAVTRAEA